MPFTDVAGKALEECNPAFSWDSLEKGVHTKLPDEVGPVRPISQAHFRSLSQDPIGGVLPSSTEKTSELTVLCSWSISHELPCVRGKSELNLERKAESVRS
jgi:hypothetical protein